MRTLCVAGILSMLLPFAVSETAHAAGIVSNNGGSRLRTAPTELLAAPGKYRKNRDVHLTAPKIIRASTPPSTFSNPAPGPGNTGASLSGISFFSDSTGFLGNSVFSLGGSLTASKVGAGTLSLGGSTPTRINTNGAFSGGTLSLGGSAGGGVNTWSGAVTINAGSVIDFGGAGGEFYIGRNGTANGTATVDGAGSAINVLSREFRVSNDGLGVLNITNGGTVNISAEPVIVPDANQSVTINGGSLNTGGTVSLTGGTVNMVGGTVNVNGWNGVGTDSEAVIVPDATQGLTINGLETTGGTLSLTGAVHIGAATGGTSWLTGGTVNINAGSVQLRPNRDVLNGSLLTSAAVIDAGSEAVLTLSGFRGKVLNIGSGTITLAGTSSEHPSINVTGGTLNLTASQTLDTLTIGPGAVVTVSGATTQAVTSQGAQPVPEPSVGALLALSAAAVFARRRKRA